MKRLSWCAVCVALVLAAGGCKQRKNRVQAGSVETAPALASAVLMSDSHAASQLVSGFYGIENGAWRWTGKQFTLTLGTPPGAAQSGGVLVLSLTVPPVTIEKLQSVTLTATVNGAALPPETYNKPGQYTFRREIPAAALSGPSARASFQLDKAMPPSGGDLRELGIIVSRAALQPK